MAAHTSRKNTVLVRCPKDIYNVWKLRFPEMENAQIIRATWNSSALKLEARARGPNWKPPKGRDIYGKKIKKVKKK